MTINHIKLQGYRQALREHEGGVFKACPHVGNLLKHKAWVAGWYLGRLATGQTKQ